MRSARFCIWGGRRRDIWIGSSEDRYATTVRKLLVETTVLGRRLGTVLSEPLRNLARAIGRL